MMRLLLLMALLAGCGGAADTLLPRRGFPSSGGGPGGLTPAPVCEAPACWSAGSPQLNLGMAPDGSGGLHGLAWNGEGWDIEHPGGTTSITSGAALMHFDDSGVLDRWEGFDSYVNPKRITPTGDGGLLLVVGGEPEVLGETLEGALSVLKLDADWNVLWQLHAPTGGALPLIDAYGAPDGGALIVSRNRKAILDAAGVELLGTGDGQVNTLHGLLRVDPDGAPLWTRRTFETSTANVGADGGITLWLPWQYGLDQPLWDGSVLPVAESGAEINEYVLRTDEGGDLSWILPIATFQGLNPGGGFAVGTSDGGAWITPAWYRPFGSINVNMTLEIGNWETELPTAGVYAQNVAIVRVNGSGEVVELSWPHVEVNGSTEFATGQLFDVALDVDDGLLISGRMLAFRIPLNDVEPFDAGLMNVGGPNAEHSGDFLARMQPNGRGDWVLPHSILNESLGSGVATDGVYAFMDWTGPDFERTPTGPGGPLVRVPLAE